MIKHYREMLIIALIMSALVSIIAWGEEGLSDNGNNPTVDGAVSGDSGVSSGDAVVVQPVNENEGNNENNKDSEDTGNNEQIPNPFLLPEGNHDNASDSGDPYDNFYSDWYLYSVSVDSLKLLYFENISQNLISIDEVIREDAKIQRSIKEQLSRIDARDADYQARVLYYLTRLAKLVSGNGAEVLGINEVSMDEIRIALSLNDFYEVSEDMIEYEEISENKTEENESISSEDVESISPDSVSIDSVSKADIEKLQEQNEQLHDDLKGIFIVNIFAVIFLALLTAGQLEQIIFKRIRG